VSDWSELLAEMSHLEPPADVSQSVLGETRQQEDQTVRGRPQRGHRWPVRRPLSIALGATAIAVVLAALALAAHSRRDASATSPAPPKPKPARVALVYAKPTGTAPFAGGPEVIYVASPSGGHPMRLATGADPVISPDGRWVVYRRGTHDQPAQLLVISSQGGTPRRLSALSYDPVVWSSNSRLVAAGDSGRVAIIDVRSGRARTFPLPDGSGPEGSFGFSFSPDGSELAFTHSTETGQDVYTVSTQGGVIRRLTKDGRSGFPLWGPSGIAFERFGVDGQRGDVWLMDETGGGVHQLTNTHAGIYPAAWSSDGTRLLAAYPARNNGKLYAVDVSTGRARPLTGFVGDLFAQGLSRDGHTVLAAIGCGGTESPFGIIETISFTGGKPTVIAHGPCRASWNA
jgi:hypothetical protein